MTLQIEGSPISIDPPFRYRWAKLDDGKFAVFVERFDVAGWWRLVGLMESEDSAEFFTTLQNDILEPTIPPTDPLEQPPNFDPPDLPRAAGAGGDFIRAVHQEIAGLDAALRDDPRYAKLRGLCDLAVLYGALRAPAPSPERIGDAPTLDEQSAPIRPTPIEERHPHLLVRGPPLADSAPASPPAEPAHLPQDDHPAIGHAHFTREGSQQEPLTDRICARPGCGNLIPVRRARKPKTLYCSPECAEIVARERAQRQAEQKAADEKPAKPEPPPAGGGEAIGRMSAAQTAEFVAAVKRNAPFRELGEIIAKKPAEYTAGNVTYLKRKIERALAFDMTAASFRPIPPPRTPSRNRPGTHHPRPPNARIPTRDAIEEAIAAGKMTRVPSPGAPGFAEVAGEIVWDPDRKREKRVPAIAPDAADVLHYLRTEGDTVVGRDKTGTYMVNGVGMKLRDVVERANRIRTRKHQEPFTLPA